MISVRPRSCCWSRRTRSRYVVEAAPGVGIVECLLGERGDLVEALLEERLDDLLLVGEAAVGRADADAGVGGDVVHRDVEAALGEHLAGRGQQPLAVALGIPAQRAFGAVLRRHGAHRSTKRTRTCPFRATVMRTFRCPLTPRLEIHEIATYSSSPAPAASGRPSPAARAPASTSCSPTSTRTTSRPPPRRWKTSATASAPSASTSPRANRSTPSPRRPPSWATSPRSSTPPASRRSRRRRRPSSPSTCSAPPWCWRSSAA